MGTYEHSATVDASPDKLFGYLSDVNHLPEYFASMEAAEKQDATHVHVAANVEGTRREGEAWMEADEHNRRLRWESEGPNHYGGELAVSAMTDGRSQVTVALHTEHADGPAIRAGLEQTLANIKREVEGSGIDRH